MSAAVVPGAKLLACTEYRPDDIPRIEMFWDLLEGKTLACDDSLESDASRRLARAFWAAAEVGREGTLFCLIELAEAERYSAFSNHHIAAAMNCTFATPAGVILLARLPG